MLKPGKRGLGFAVGEEPFPAYFAARGVEVLATDLWDSNTSSRWTQSQNLGGNKQILNKHGLCPSDLFKRHVHIKNVDMNYIPLDLVGFDFAWSSCAVEHIGNFQLGKEFFIKHLNVLKSGGISIHIVEFKPCLKNKSCKIGRNM